MEQSTAFSAMQSIFSDVAVEGRQSSYGAGSVLHEPEAPATELFLIVEGQLRIIKLNPNGSSMLLEILGPGQWFGTPAIAGEPTYGTRALVMNPAIIWRANAGVFLKRVASDPGLATEFIRQLALRELAAREDATRLVFDDCNSRLVKTLLRFSETSAASPRDEGVILRITHQQLAQAVGVARETVSLALTQLRKQNMLRTGRNQLIFNPDVLRRFQASQQGQPVA
jgi:CRP/FNR family transcriptional regulator, cyclic AMP receptor protein